MGKPAAKLGDQITSTNDMHDIVPPSGPPPVSTPHPFSGIIDSSLSADVRIMGQPAATAGSTATNTPPHVPIGGAFAKPPSNKGKITTGSQTVFINGKPAARLGDKALTCNDPVDLDKGTVIATGTVMIG